MLKTEIKELFERKFGNDFNIFSAPGRINIIGEHTDYNEGFVLPAAIDKKIYLAIAPGGGTTVNIVSTDFNESVEFDIKDTKPDLPHWAKYPFGVIKELQALGYYPGGFNAVFGGDIPTGAGLSSSAAIECAFSGALNVLFEFGADKFTLARIGQSAEHKHVGVRCGIMDQFTSFFGKKENVVFIDCRSLEHEYYPLNLQDYELVIADTQVKHSLASSAYNERRMQCEEGVKKISNQHTYVKSLRDVTFDMLYDYKKKLEKEVFLRCEYVLEENERVLKTCKALQNNDISQVGELLLLSHEGLKNKYEVSCNELDLLIETSKQIEGVMGARMMGGGFGGCTISLVKSQSVEAFKSEVSRAYQKEFNKPPVFYEVKIEDGVKQEML